MRIVCDNSECDKPIHCFKFKLHRTYEGRCSRGWVTRGSKYLVTKKEGSCDPNSKVDLTVDIEIPRLDEYNNYVEQKIHADELPMLKSFSTSVKGSLITVEYTLRCYVKHAACTEMGEGNVVTLPIKIM